MDMFIKHKQKDKDNKFRLSSVVNDDYKLSFDCNLDSFFYFWKLRKVKRFKNYQTSMTCTIDFSRKNSDINDIYHSYDSNKQLYNKQLQIFDSQKINWIQRNMTIDARTDVEVKIDSIVMPQCFLVEKYVGLFHAINLPQIFSNYFPKLKVFAIIRNPTDRFISRVYFGRTEKRARENIMDDSKNDNYKMSNDRKINIVEYFYNNDFKNDYKHNKMSIDYQLNHLLDKQCLIFSNELDKAISRQESFSRIYSHVFSFVVVFVSVFLHFF